MKTKLQKVLLCMVCIVLAMSMITASAAVVAPEIGKGYNSLFEYGATATGGNGKMEDSINNGYFIHRFSGGANGSQSSIINKKLDEPLPTTGVVTLELGVKSYTQNGVIVKLLSGSDVIAECVFGRYEGDSYINGSKVKSKTSHGLFTDNGTKTATISVTLNYINNRIKIDAKARGVNFNLTDLYFNDAGIQVDATAEGAKLGYPITKTGSTALGGVDKIQIMHENSNYDGTYWGTMGLGFDYITLTNTVSDSSTTIIDDQFNDEGKLINEYGYYFTSGSYSYFDGDSFGFVHFTTPENNWNFDPYLTVPLGKTITNGIAVIEFDMTGKIVYNDGKEDAILCPAKATHGIIQINGNGSKRIDLAQNGATDGYRAFTNGPSGATITSQIKYTNAKRRFQFIANCDTGALDIYMAEGGLPLSKISVDGLTMGQDANGKYQIDSLSFYNYFGAMTDMTIAYKQFDFSNITVYNINGTDEYESPVILKDSDNTATTYLPGDTVNAYVPLYKTDGKDTTIIFVLYDENDAFVDVVSQAVSVPAGNAASDVSLAKAEYTIPSFALAGYKLKAFVWSDLTAIIPYALPSDIVLSAAE